MGKRIAFVGLGVMGYPMAAHLAAAGHDVTVHNRSRDKADRWVAEHGGRLATSAAESADGAEVVFTCVGDDRDVRAVTLDAGGALEGMREGSVLVDHTTASASLAREIAAVAACAGVEFLDAPVSGGEAGARNGALSIMVGGEPAVFERIAPIVDGYARSFVLMGPVGSGQLTKMVNQICIAGLLEGLAEGLHFAECAGLDVRKVIEAISRGAAQSWQMENRSTTMSARQFSFGFAVDWMRKDLAIAFEEAQRNGARLPVARIVDSFYADVQGVGGRRWDTSSLIARYAKPR
jgi:3-hydroxyisobutyrate dehydrogenase-like beta-hydroxyacid dehydrogenase